MGAALPPSWAPFRHSVRCRGRAPCPGRAFRGRSVPPTGGVSRPHPVLCQERGSRRRDPAGSRSTAPGAAGRAPRSGPASPFRYGRYEFSGQLRSGATRPVGRARPVQLCGRPAPPVQRDRHRGRQVGRSPRSDDAQLVQQPYRRRGNTSGSPSAASSLHHVVGLDEGQHRLGITDGTGALVSARSKPTPFKPAGELVHLNLWLAEGHAPARPLAIEIASFETPVLDRARRLSAPLMDESPDENWAPESSGMQRSPAVTNLACAEANGRP